jgi:hypothetical protein
MKFEKIAALDGVVSPPMTQKNNSQTHSVIIGIGSTLKAAQKDYQRIRKELLDIISS